MGVHLFKRDDPRLWRHTLVGFMERVGLQESGEGEEDDGWREEEAEIEVKLTCESHEVALIWISGGPSVDRSAGCSCLN